MPKNWKGGPFEVLQHPFCRKTWKNWRKNFIFGKKPHNAKKLKGGNLWDFSTSILSQKIKKNAGGTLWGKNSRKNVSQCRKKWKGVLLVLPGMICYAEKQGKLFWSSSLGQVVQCDTIIFGRFFKNYFGQFVWIEKKSHYNSRVSHHEAPTKKCILYTNTFTSSFKRRNVFPIS